MPSIAYADYKFWEMYTQQFQPLIYTLIKLQLKPFLNITTYVSAMCSLKNIFTVESGQI